ncbi:hypothetical protein Salat_0314700 [Sesamum alatum]|uniref:Uncharacterized protein n=1 Tax=Sesamum alatum TaxID=300844 RepID=A0AAE1Z1S4_9LAMI|nr:hypothetical protein Salat_0314700 [Sesamum alatum]
MKITVERTSVQEAHHPRPTLTPLPPSDLSYKPTFPGKPPRRKPKTSGAGVRVRRESTKRSSRPETPLLRWKFDESNDKINSVEEEKSSGEVGRKSGRRVRPVVSARKLGAGLWRLHLPELQTNGGGRLGLQFGDARFGAPIHGQHVDRIHSSPANDMVHSPHSVSGSNGLVHKYDPSFQCPNSAMEGATKWDPVVEKTSDELKQIFGQKKLPNRRAREAPVISALETQLEQARARINELETERRSSKKKLEQFLQKLSDERAAWRSREHEKIRAVIDDMKVELSREKKSRQRLELVNSKLVNELADVKLSAKRYFQEYEKERKARELVEEVCDELAKEIGEDKAEVETLKQESMKLWEEVEEERKMLQMAEVWREERVQMKLVDAKVMLEEKYSQMNRIIADLEAFLSSKSRTSDSEEMNKAEFLREVATSINIQDIRELTYEPPNPDDIFSIFEDVNVGESNEREVDSKLHTVTPEVKRLNKDSSDRHLDVHMDKNHELEEDASEWETVSHPEDQGSIYSPDGSDPSVNKSFRVSNVSRNGGDETPTTEISEAGSAQPRQLKKASSISRFWRSCPSNGDNYKIISVEGITRRISNGRLSNGAITSTDCDSGKGGISPHDLAGQWSSPDSGNPHINRGMKGCIEWPRNAQKSSLKARLLEARMESQKIQLRQVLKQKI